MVSDMRLEVGLQIFPVVLKLETCDDGAHISLAYLGHEMVMLLPPDVKTMGRPLLSSILRSHNDIIPSGVS
jgi:hypothetical protein